MIIDGRKILASILEGLKQEVKNLPFQPVFCDVLVGDDEVSASYVRIKAKTAEKIGIKFRHAKYPENISATELISEIKKIGQEPNMCGLIVQLPLPENLPRQEILDAVERNIDVDCMNSANLGRFYKGDIYLIPPTAAAIIEILKTLKVDLSKKNILVVGQGELVGKPVSFLLKKQGFQVNQADKNTQNKESLFKSADVIISATGKPGIVTGSMIKPGSIVIDAGTSEANGGGIVGDADFESVSKVASTISPVPGGVGPVTVAMLLKNVLTVAQKQKSGKQQIQN